MKTQNEKTFKIVKFIFDKELNNSNNKIYKTKEDAENAGNSWTRDCTVHAELRKGRWFKIVEIN